MRPQLWPAIADQLERRIRLIEALGKAAPAQSIPVAIDTVRECIEALRLGAERFEDLPDSPILPQSVNLETLAAAGN